MEQVSRLAFQNGDSIQFIGAKLTVFVGSRIITLQRDNDPKIAWPNHWDLPGGGRENGESPFDCVARETMEEVNLKLEPTDLLWARAYHSRGHDRWFFVARLSEARAAPMQLGDEGQQIKMMTPDDYLTHPKAIPNFQNRMADWIAGL